MATYKVMIAQFPYGNVTHPDVSDWVAETLCKMRDDPRIGKGNCFLWRKADTPITMVRNRCLKTAREAGVDYVLMIDSDMSPDLPYPGAKPFWDSSWEFMRAHAGPCVVAAPYCGPSPCEAVYVFRWQTHETDNPNPDFQIEAYSRPEAAAMTGIQRAAGLATGLMLIDMKATVGLPPNPFRYEYRDASESEKAATEDVVFSRDLTYAGVPIFCNWDSWAGHWKPKRVGKPALLPPELVPAWLRERARELGPVQTSALQE